MNDCCLSLPTGGSAVAHGHASPSGTQPGGSANPPAGSPSGGSCLMHFAVLSFLCAVFLPLVFSPYLLTKVVALAPCSHLRTLAPSLCFLPLTPFSHLPAPPVSSHVLLTFLTSRSCRCLYMQFFGTNTVRIYSNYGDRETQKKEPHASNTTGHV